MSGNILFRSDLRHPYQNRIFSGGFQAWQHVAQLALDDQQWEQQIYRQPIMGRAGDIDSNLAVCLSRRTAGAALFPYGNNNTRDSWMYVVYCDSKDIFSTHNKQIVDGWAIANSGNTANPNYSWWAIRAHEIAVRSVEANQIIAALECYRGVTDRYRLNERTLLINRNCNVTQQWRDAALEAVRNVARDGSQQRALPGTGFHASTGT